MTKRTRHIDHLPNKSFIVGIDRSGEIHDMACVSVSNRRQHQNPFRHRTANTVSNAAWANQIDIQRKMFAVLFDRSAGNDANLLGLDRFVNSPQY